MTIAEHSMVRLRRALTAADGRLLEPGCEGAVVHIGRSSIGGTVGYIVEFFIENRSLRAGHSSHLGTVEPDDIELVDNPTSHR